MTDVSTQPALPDEPHVLARRLRQALAANDLREAVTLRKCLQSVLSRGNQSNPRLVRSVRSSVRWSTLSETMELLTRGWEVCPIGFVRLLRWQGVSTHRLAQQAAVSSLASCNIRIAMKLDLDDPSFSLANDTSMKAPLSLLDRQLARTWSSTERLAYWNKCLRVVERRHLAPREGCLPFTEGPLVEALLALGARPDPATFRVALGVNDLDWPQHEVVLDTVRVWHPEAVAELDPDQFPNLGSQARAWLMSHRMGARLPQAVSCSNVRL